MDFAKITEFQVPLVAYQDRTNSSTPEKPLIWDKRLINSFYFGIQNDTARLFLISEFYSTTRMISSAVLGSARPARLFLIPNCLRVVLSCLIHGAAQPPSPAGSPHEAVFRLTAMFHPLQNSALYQTSASAMNNVKPVVKTTHMDAAMQDKAIEVAIEALANNNNEQVRVVQRA
jgi:hypothetical protein